MGGSNQSRINAFYLFDNVLQQITGERGIKPSMAKSSNMLELHIARMIFALNFNYLINQLLCHVISLTCIH